jgi:hypothetical protein
MALRLKVLGVLLLVSLVFISSNEGAHKFYISKSKESFV